MGDWWSRYVAKQKRSKPLTSGWSKWLIGLAIINVILVLLTVIVPPYAQSEIFEPYRIYKIAFSSLLYLGIAGICFTLGLEARSSNYRNTSAYVLNLKWRMISVVLVFLSITGKIIVEFVLS